MSDHVKYTEDHSRWRNVRQGCLEQVEERGTSDMAPMIEGYRDGELIALVQCLQISRDDALTVLPVLVGGLALDAIVLCLDSHYSQEPINPATGEAWKPGEMQKACDEDGACSTGVITDCLMVMEHHRDGFYRQAAIPYHEDKDAKLVHWHDPELLFESDNEDTAEEVSGIIMDHVEAAFRIEPLTVELANSLEHAPSLDGTEEEQRVKLDCTISKLILAGEGHVIMLNGRSEVARSIIAESFDGFNMELVE